MIEFVERNDRSWHPPVADDPEGDETVEILVGLAASDLPVDDFVAWVRKRIGGP